MEVRVEREVERVNGKELSYESFVERYMKKNKPVLLTGLMDDWRACRDWVEPNGLPNLQFFSTHFADSIVPVADCCQKELTDQKRLEMSVSEFITHWRDLVMGNCNNNSHSLLYLKDWHFAKEYPKYVAYSTPSFFLDDWLNLYLDSHSMHRDSDSHHVKNEINCSDYCFVYMGAKGTWTPLHADVFRSYSWSANVCGKKLWHLLPPSQSNLVFDRNLKTSVYDVNGDVSETKFPGFKKAAWWECTQEQNEIIFVPSGWYHQVHNLEDTISINHNWFNAYNLLWVWNLLVKDYKEAKGYIEDIRDICDDFESLCQQNLAANTGMNYYDFFIFITRFALANLTILYNLRSEKDAKTHHLITNLQSIHEVAMRMVSAEAFAVENIEMFSNIVKVTQGSHFFELCMEIFRTYDIIEEINKKIVPSQWKLEVPEVYGSKICNPEDLVRVIDRALSNHDIVSSDSKFSLSSDLCADETLGIKGLVL